MQQAAIYGVLMRYNPKTGDYEPQLAKALEHNDDYTRWTLTLREGVEFSDGTQLDAQAVEFSINRYIQLGGEQAELMQRLGLEMSAPDAQTVVFSLAKAWPNFPYLLAESPGCIVSPAAAKKWGDDFGIHPVGAGPFTLERLAPNEEIVLKANPNYWGGRPHLNRLRFVNIDKPMAKLDTLELEGVEAAFFSTPDFVAEALAQDFFGYGAITNFAPLMYVNHRDGRPGSDLRVRKAIAYAIDPEVISQRAWQGEGLPGKALFQEYSLWSSVAQPTPYDANKAKKLLAEAKQDGYDGEISIAYWPANEDIALAIKAMLESVGFVVALDVGQTIEDVIRQYRVKNEYDLALTGANIYDAAVFPTLYEEIVPENNPAGYQNSEMTELIGELRAAASEKERRKVIADIQRLWAKTVPYIVLAASNQYIAWGERLHGVVPTLNTVMLFHDAWIEQS